MYYIHNFKLSCKNQPPRTMLSYAYTLFKFAGEYLKKKFCIENLLERKTDTMNYLNLNCENCFVNQSKCKFKNLFLIIHYKSVYFLEKSFPLFENYFFARNWICLRGESIICFRKFFAEVGKTRLYNGKITKMMKGGYSKYTPL